MAKINPDILKRVLNSLYPPEDVELTPDRLLVAKNVIEAIKLQGYEISLSQAESLWGDYSYNSFSSWMVGGETVEEASGAIADYCKDIEFGENHIGL